SQSDTAVPPWSQSMIAVPIPLQGTRDRGIVRRCEGAAVRRQRMEMASSRATAARDGKLIFIISPGRSGSTLIERVLSSAPSVFAMGEFFCLWRLPLSELRCSCGSRPQDCDVWSEVLRGAAITPEALKRLRWLEDTVSRHRFVARHRFEPQLLSNEP